MRENELPNFMPKGMKKLEEDIRAHGELLFFSDYDGTLVSFTDDPAETRTPIEVLRSLRELGRLETVNLAVISGRTIEDLKRMIPLDDIVLAGLHGMVVDYGNGEVCLRDDVEELALIIDELTGEIRTKYFGVEGLIVEDKKFVVALHYRMFQGDERKLKEDLFDTIVKGSNKRLEVLEGDKIFEIRPKGWSKGVAVDQLRERYGRDKPVLYLGDDTTDEDAFRVLKGEDRAYPVKVVKEGGTARLETHAEYMVLGVDEVRKLLELLGSVCNNCGHTTVDYRE
ncbi:MAG: trehalose-phosphatase [Thermoplasmata archaeon]